jgi:hypothetical protein
MEMAQTKRMDDWQRMAIPTTLLANIYRDRKKKPTPFTAEDFNPIRIPGRNKQKGIPLTDIQQLKVFVKGRTPGD